MNVLALKAAVRLTTFHVGFDIERVTLVVRHLLLHTSAVGFAADFTHSLLGRHMILCAAWERFHEVGVSYAGFAALLAVYIDGHRERVRAMKGERK